MKLEVSEKGDYKLYENFHLYGLNQKSMNPSKRQYISYLKTNKYLNSSDADRFFEENLYKKIDRDLKTVDSPNKFQIFPINLARINKMIRNKTEFVNEGKHFFFSRFCEKEKKI